MRFPGTAQMQVSGNGKAAWRIFLHHYIYLCTHAQEPPNEISSELQRTSLNFSLTQSFALLGSDEINLRRFQA